MNLTPKEKAKELVCKMYLVTTNIGLTYENAKQCALITVDEIIKDTIDIYYWQEVRKEIGQL